MAATLFIEHADARQSERVEISLEVVDSYTGSPVDSVRVTLLQDGSVFSSGYTDEQGKTLLFYTPTSSGSQPLLPATFEIGDNYPNPFRDQTRVDIALPGPQAVSADVFNMLGQRVATMQMQLNEGVYTMNFSLGHLSHGMYFLRIQGQEVRTVKMLKVGNSLGNSSGPLFSIQQGSRLKQAPVGVLSGDGIFTLRLSKDPYDNLDFNATFAADTTLTLGIDRNNTVRFNVIDSEDEEPVSLNVTVESDNFQDTFPSNQEITLRSGLYFVTTPQGTYDEIQQQIEIASRDTTITIAVSKAPPGQPEGLVGVTGIIVDDHGLPLADVRVRLGSDEMIDDLTDENGRFYLSDVPTGLEQAFLFTKAGYVAQSYRTFLPDEVELGYIEVILKKRDDAITIASAEEGGSATGRDGAEIIIPPNSLVDRNGNPVTGPVDVFITPIDTDSDEIETFPGSFEAVSGGVRVDIATLGVAEFVIEQNGEEVDFASGTIAEVLIPVFAELNLDGTPIQPGDEFPLWFLDPITGVWSEEGSGTVETDPDNPGARPLFRAPVTRTGWWNCDIAFDSAQMRFRFRLKGSPTNVGDEIKGGQWGGDIQSDIFSEIYTNILLRAIPPRGFPRSAPSAIVSPGGSNPLFIPPGFEFEYIATANNGLLRGTSNFVAEPFGEHELEIELEPVDVDPEGEIERNSILTGLINPPGSVLTYTFEALADEILELRVMAAEGSDVDGRVTIYSPEGSAVTTGRFSAATPAPGAFKVTESGTYRVDIAGLSPDPGLVTIFLAGIEIIAVDEDTAGEFDAGEFGIFAFEASEGDHFNIATIRTGGDGTFDLEVLNDQGIRVARGSIFGNSSTGFDQTGVFTLPADGTYTIHLDGRQDAGGAYLLGLASIAVPADLAVAPPVVEASGSVDVLGKRYFYRFTGSEGDLVNVALSHDEGTLTGRIDLRAPGEQAFYSRASRRSATTTQSNRENSINTWRLNASGEWIIEVDPAGNSSNVLERAKGAYRLGLYTPEPATAISYDSEAERELVPYEIQLFSFAGSAGDHLNIAELRLGGTGTIDLLIYDEAGEQVNRGSIFGNSSTGFDQTGVFTLPADGTY
ncbi:MAG: pre-peptidase C-terminal domain-containing protein, partial [Cyclonatronaceae bacterium]